MVIADKIDLAHERAILGGRRVLVVDDDVICQDIVLLMLDRLGCHADLATSGVDAVEALHAASYDVVLMDVQMPRMNGLEAARLMRAELDPTDQPIIVAMTADTTARCREDCRQAGMDGNVGKPIGFGDLVTALKQESNRHGTVDSEPDEPGTADTVSTVILDATVFESLMLDLGADRALRADLIGTSIVDIRERQAEIARAGDTSNLGALAFQAHALKSASATFGLVALTVVASGIEAAARAIPEEIDVGLQASLLVAECAEAIEAFECMAAEHP
jgi:two-component system, sensor histidine kinase and response regulator